MYNKALVLNVRAGATGAEVVKMYAVSRIMLNNSIPNLQVSWVKEGPKLSQLGLMAGAKDFGGTLLKQRISTAAGAGSGPLLKPPHLPPLTPPPGRIPGRAATT